jgi:O-antigen/teichoic acid export membrane protein
MDVITRQTIKGSVYSYLGALLGFVNVALLMPKIFSTSEIGLTNILIAISSIMGQIGTLGFPNVTSKLFPFFRNQKNKHNGFVFLMLTVGVGGFLLCSLFYYIFKNKIIGNNIDNSPLLAEYVYLLIPFIFIQIFYFLIDNYNKTLFNASFGIFVKEFLHRILNLVGILLFYFNFFNFHSFIIYYTIVFGVPVLLICMLLIYKGDFSLKPSKELLTPEFRKQIISVAFFGFMAGSANITVSQIDRLFINKYYDLVAIGIYSVMFYFGSMVLVPGRSLVRISGAVISELFKHDDLCEINKVYKKSINTLATVGVFLFILIWGNINNILHILNPEYAQGKYVILFIGLAHLFQMFAGTSGEIISFGKYYRQFAVIIFILILCIIGFNILFLPIFGIVGAGIAFAISFFIYLLIRFFYVKIKYGYQPYDAKFFTIISIGAITYFVSLLIPEFNNFVIDLIIRTIILSLLFFAPVYYLKLCDEMNLIIDKVFKLIKRRRKN